MQSGHKLFDRSSGSINAAIEETIKLYFNHYIRPNLARLLTGESLISINDTLDKAKVCSPTELKVYLIDKYQHFEIVCIYNTLQRLIKGELTSRDLLMSSLRKIDGTISLDQYNRRISLKISASLDKYFHKMIAPQPTSIITFPNTRALSNSA